MKVCLFLKKPGKSFSKCSSESPWGIMVAHVSPPSPLPSASPSLHEELWMEVFLSLLLVKLWSIQPILVYKPYSYLKRACQFIINSSNYIVTVKRHKWDWECTAATVRDLFRPSLARRGFQAWSYGQTLLVETRDISSHSMWHTYELTLPATHSASWMAAEPNSS